MPGLQAMSKSPSHQSRYPCKDCCQETEHAHNRNHGLYLPYKPQSSNGSAARLRTKQDYQEGDPAHGIHSLSLLSGMKLFNGSLVFNVDEMHTIGRGIGFLVFDMLTVAATKNTIFHHKTEPDRTRH